MSEEDEKKKKEAMEGGEEVTTVTVTVAEEQTQRENTQAEGSNIQTQEEQKSGSKTKGQDEGGETAVEEKELIIVGAAVEQKSGSKVSAVTERSMKNEIEGQDDNKESPNINAEEEKQKKEEIEKLENERKELKEENMKAEKREAQLKDMEKSLSGMKLEGIRTESEILGNIHMAKQEMKDHEEDRSKTDLKKKRVSEKIESLKAVDENDPEINALMTELARLEQEVNDEEETKALIVEKMAKLDRLLEEHQMTQSEVDASKTKLEAELATLELEKEVRIKRERSIEDRIAILKNEALPAKPIGSDHTVKSEAENARLSAISTISFPLKNLAALIELRKEGERAILTAKALRDLKNEISEFAEKEELTDEDFSILPAKQEELLTRMAELEEITKRVQSLMGMAEIAYAELGPPKKRNLSSYVAGGGVGRVTRTMSDFLPEHTLPKVIICGDDSQVPQIIVCENTPLRRGSQAIFYQHRSTSIGRISQIRQGLVSESLPNFPPAESRRRDSNSMAAPVNGRQFGDGYPPGMNFQCYPPGMMGAYVGRTPAPGQYPLQSPVGMAAMQYPPWMMSSFAGPLGANYVGRPMLEMIQSASLSSLHRCPCGKRRKHKCRKKKKSSLQTYSCPCVFGKGTAERYGMQ